MNRFKSWVYHFIESFGRGTIFWSPFKKLQKQQKPKLPEFFFQTPATTFNYFHYE